MNTFDDFRLAVDGLRGQHGGTVVRTLILVFICAAFVACGVLDAKAGQKDRFHVIQTGAISLVLGITTCWFLVYVVGIFDGWTYSLRR